MLGEVKKFKETLEDFTGGIFEMHQSIYDNDLTNIDPAYSESINILITENNDTKFIDIFINHHQDWVHIKNRNEIYIDELFNSLKNAKGAISILDYRGFKLPFKVKDEHPDIIEQDDIDFIWDALQTLVKISCNYVHLGREPTLYGDDNFEYTNKDFYPDLDLEIYSNMFNIEYN